MNNSQGLDKFILMKILQSKGFVSFDEWNYNDISYYITELLSANKVIHTIKIQFSGGPTESITLQEYKTFKRNITIDNILQCN